jgi:glutathione S-transferase
VGGQAISVADLKVFVALTPLLKGAIDHIPASTFQPFGKVLGLHEAVKAHPRIVAWYARTSDRVTA